MLSFASLVLALACTSSLAAPVATVATVTPTRLVPYNVAQPASTPAYAFPPAPSNLLTGSALAAKVGATRGSKAFTALAKRQTITTNHGINCLDSSNTDQDINSLFSAGGANTTVFLCPNAVLLTLNTVQFTAESQTLATLGFPTDSSRAKLVVMGAYQTAAVYGTNSGANYCAVRNVAIDGSRPLLGQLSLFASGLIEMGGNNVGQIVDSIVAYGESLELAPLDQH